MARHSKNRYAHLIAPQRELDFHESGKLTGQRVKRMTRDFIDEARRDGLQRVRIITGKGLHSKGRPLVGPQVRRTLDALMADGDVADWFVAKDTEGGDGALDVRLS